MATTRTAEVWRDDEGIVHVVYVPGVSIDERDALENLSIQRELAGSDGRLLTLVDTRSVHAISREARACFSGREAVACNRALALLVDSPVSRAVGNFFIGVSNPPFPTRLFSDEAEALGWLRAQAARGPAGS